MEYPPRPTSTPPPVEPLGFFTGVQPRPILVGVVVDYIATYAMMYGYFFFYLARQLSKQGEVSPEVLGEYMLSQEGLWIGFLIGALGTALGGFVAALKAGRLETKHGAFVGLGSLIVSVIEQGLQDDRVALPEWFRFLSVVAIIPAGALGGFVAQLFKSIGLGASSGDGPQRRM